ncbi:MAG: hypothetical protein M3P91_08300 [Actinomycetota bacterium]|nr:hypothetical protein [Actinomycetota bacterium]
MAVTWADQAEPAQVEVSVRVRSARGWSDWHKLGGQNDAGVNPGAPEVRGRVIRDGTAPLWVGDSDGVQARVDAVAGPAPRDLRTGTNRPRA